MFNRTELFFVCNDLLLRATINDIPLYILLIFPPKTVAHSWCEVDRIFYLKDICIILSEITMRFLYIYDRCSTVINIGLDFHRRTYYNCTEIISAFLMYNNITTPFFLFSNIKNCIRVFFFLVYRNTMVLVSDI